MKFSLTAVVLALATSAVALPGLGPQTSSSGNDGAGNGVGNSNNGNIRFPVKKDLTVQEAQTKCGDQASLSCCNKATYAGDTTTADSGILGGALSGLISGGSGSDGLGLFDQCSKLPLDISVIAVGVNDLVNQQCKQNIACCQNSPSTATGLVGVGLPCVALGSII